MNSAVMSSVVGSSFSLVALLDRSIRALAQADAAALGEVLADCNKAGPPASAEEFSRALVRQAAFERVLEQTDRNIRMLRAEENGFRYGRSRGDNS